VETFDELQRRLRPAWDANRPGSTEPHVVIALPSYSVGESLLSHYAERIPALEHRYLLAQMMLGRIEACELVFLCSRAPEAEVLDYYLSLFPAEKRASVRDRLRVVEIPDESARSIAAKVLDRVEVLEELRASLAGRPAFVEPWNVTPYEVEVALRLGTPINGTSPELWSLGHKSAGRRMFRELGVPLPFGVEDVRSLDDVLAAVDAVRSARPDAPGVVVKLDDSGAGDGNVVVGFDADVEAAVRELPEWYVSDLQNGGVVEELVAGCRFSSPSVQVDIRPDGDVNVLSTHEQVFDDDSGQVYTGCRFPAEPAYAPELAAHGLAVGRHLAAQGALGRFSVDFAAMCDEAGTWRVFALEVNLRKGGTTHPYATLRHLVPGRYDPEAGRWVAEDGSARAYVATDNLVDPAWVGLPPGAVIDAVRRAGLHFDAGAGTGVVLYMLSGLAVDGRFGAVAIGRTPEHAAELFEATRSAAQCAHQKVG
jgi:hypothetical protein